LLSFPLPVNNSKLIFVFIYEFPYWSKIYNKRDFTEYYSIDEFSVDSESIAKLNAEDNF